MVELMGAVVISIVLILMLYSIFDKVQSIFLTGQNRARAMDEARATMDMLARDFARVEGVAGLQAMSRMSIGNEGEGLMSEFEFSNLREPVGIIPLGVDAVADSVGQGFSLEQHDWRFVIKEDGGAYRRVRFRWAGLDHYKELPNDSPIGALWVYRSSPVASIENLGDENSYIRIDGRAVSGDDLCAFGKMVAGVVHFKVERLNSKSIKVELGVVDGKLMKEVEYEMGQQFEGVNPSAIDPKDERLKALGENLDRIYFFQQIINR